MDCVEKITKSIINEFSNFLESNPNEIKNSIGFVKSNLQPKHVEAAIWLRDFRKIAMNAYNLHNLIVNFDRCQSIARHFDFVVNMDLPDNEEFNPVYLVEYFQVIRGFVKF
jgi:hypothetical protein